MHKIQERCSVKVLNAITKLQSTNQIDQPATGKTIKLKEKDNYWRSVALKTLSVGQKPAT